MKKIHAKDSLMEEIHSIREEHHKQTKSLSFSKMEKDVEDRAKAFLFSHGYKLVPTTHGTYKFVLAHGVG
jgi:hypothetical protein